MYNLILFNDWSINKILKNWDARGVLELQSFVDVRLGVRRKPNAKSRRV